MSAQSPTTDSVLEAFLVANGALIKEADRLGESAETDASAKNLAPKFAAIFRQAQAVVARDLALKRNLPEFS